MTIAPLPLDTYQQITLPQGTIHYQESGTGPTLVFVHGLFVNSMLWRQVIPQLSQHFRCVALDLPLGAHYEPLHVDADLTPPGVADLVGDFLEALNLKDITLVGNDTGGAICQLVISRHPERIARLVLTNCDAFEDFFPLSLRPFSAGARLLGTRFADFLALLFRSRAAQRLLVRSVSYSRPDNQLLDVFFTPLLTDADVRRDLTKFLRAISNRYTLEAARSFGHFQQPVLLVWGKNDIFFSRRLAIRLQQAFPHATLEYVARSRAFVPEDRPEVLAQRIAEFVNEPVHS